MITTSISCNNWWKIKEEYKIHITHLLYYLISDWVSFLAYLNLFGIKDFVVIVVVFSNCSIQIHTTLSRHWIESQIQACPPFKTQGATTKIWQKERRISFKFLIYKFKEHKPWFFLPKFQTIIVLEYVNNKWSIEGWFYSSHKSLEVTPK
jgi:hypothetical protein